MSGVLPGARARIERTVRVVAAKVFPAHWSFLLGELALFSFVVLVASGLYLSLFYEASAEPVVYDGSYEPLVGVEVPAAYASVLDISFDRPAGLLARQVHHWSALVFVASLVAHAARVFFTGAFRRPRRLNWAIGVTLLGLALANGFFGLALPHDVLGGTGTRIGNAFATSVPLVGPGLASVVFGGEFPAPGMLHRLWQLHVVVLPLALGSLLAAHLALVFAQSHTQPRGRRQREGNVVGAAAWPGYALKTVGLLALVTAVLVALGALVEVAPVWLYGPFEPSAVTVPAQPDWYLGWVEGALRIIPGLDVGLGPWEVPSPFFAGIALPLLVFGVLYAWPLLEERVTGDRGDHHLLDRPRDRPVRTALGVGGLALLAVLLAAGSHDLQGLLLGVSVDVMTDVYRVLALVVPPLAGFLTWMVCRDLARSSDERRRGAEDLVAAPVRAARAPAGGGGGSDADGGSEVRG